MYSAVEQPSQPSDELKTLEWVEATIIQFLNTTAADPDYRGTGNVGKFRSHVIRAMKSATDFCASPEGQRAIETLREMIPNTEAALKMVAEMPSQ